MQISTTDVDSKRKRQNLIYCVLIGQAKVSNTYFRTVLDSFNENNRKELFGWTSKVV